MVNMILFSVEMILLSSSIRIGENFWKVVRRGWEYHADFKVIYNNGEYEVIDVKGYADQRFPLVKKMFEHTQNKPLTVVKKIKGKWVKK